jgi:hypothetical protein
VQVQLIVVEGLRGQKMDFQIPGQSSWNRQRRGTGSDEASVVREGLGGKASRVKYSTWFRVGMGNYWGVSPGVAVPENCLAPWVS